jgi:hypothetical protein
MTRQGTWRIVVALVVALAVLAIFVSPVTDSPRSALRAKQLAQLIFLALLALATMFAGVISSRQLFVPLQGTDSAPPPLLFSSELILPLLC